jgi:hypothetical protein
MRIRSSLFAVLFAVPLATLAVGQTPPNVRVSVEFRQSQRTARDAVEGRGRVIITERSPRARGGVGVESTDTKVRQMTGVFTILSSGGEAMITLAQQVPYPEVAYYRDYATGHGYAVPGVAFRDVGTSLKVNATVQPNNQISVRVTPMISYFSADGSGAIEFTRAATDIVVKNGQPVVIAGGTTESNAVTRRILGLSETRQSGETLVVLTATIQ